MSRLRSPMIRCGVISCTMPSSSLNELLHSTGKNSALWPVSFWNLGKCLARIWSKQSYGVLNITVKLFSEPEILETFHQGSEITNFHWRNSPLWSVSFWNLGKCLARIWSKWSCEVLNITVKLFSEPEIFETFHLGFEFHTIFQRPLLAMLVLTVKHNLRHIVILIPNKF